jgi:hypothetical protein
VNSLEATKTVVGTPCTSATTTATLTLDTLGFGLASVEVIVDKSAVAGHTAASILSVLKCVHYDSTAATSATFTTSLPAASAAVTSQASVIRFDVSMAGKGRYLKVDATPATTLVTNIVARLANGENAPSSASEQGTLASYSG